MSKTVVKFAFEKETKNSIRFMETGDEAGHKIGTLYVKKVAFEGKVPQAITVTVEA